MLKPEVNANALRNDVTDRKPDLEYFTAHLENKALKVTYESKDLCGLVDEDGEFWRTDRCNVIPASQFTTVGQELTQGRSVNG